MTEPTSKALKGSSAAVVAAGIAAAALLIMPFEGKRNIGYLDPSHIPTACWGKTGSNVVVGRYYTDAECKAFLTADVKAHAAALQKCITGPVSAETFGAMVSFGYNAGPSVVCGRFAPLINAGKPREACAKLTLYVYSRDRRSGKMVKYKGLINRRAAERRLCEQGLA